MHSGNEAPSVWYKAERNRGPVEGMSASPKSVRARHQLAHAGQDNTRALLSLVMESQRPSAARLTLANRPRLSSQAPRKQGRFGTGTLYVRTGFRCNLLQSEGLAPWPAKAPGRRYSRSLQRNGRRSDHYRPETSSGSLRTKVVRIVAPAVHQRRTQTENYLTALPARQALGVDRVEVVLFRAFTPVLFISEGGSSTPYSSSAMSLDYSSRP